MDWYWTWGGECFGFRKGDSLFTHDGLEVGRFDGNEVCGVDGAYLGEVKAKSRLITNISKKSKRQGAFAPRQVGGYVKYVNDVGNVMYAGYEDFPSPDTL